MSSKLEKVLILGLGLMPWVVGGGYSPYEIPKALFVMVWSLVLTGMGLRLKRGRDAKPQIIWAMTSLLGWLVVASVVGNDFGQSLVGNPYRFDGLLTLLALLLISLITATIYQPKLKSPLVLALSISGGAVAIATIGSLGIGQSTPRILFGNENILAGYLATTLPFTIAYAIDKGRYAWIAPGLITLAVITTGSWGAMLAVGVAGICYWPARFWTKLGVMAGITILMSGIFQYKLEETIRERGVIVAERRERIIAKALLGIAARPLTGWGVAQYDQVFATMIWPTKYEIEPYVDRAHSSILELGVAGGIPALAIGTYLIWMSVGSLKGRADRQLWLTVLAVYLVHSQTNVTSVVEEVYLALTLGVALQRVS